MCVHLLSRGTKFETAIITMSYEIVRLITMQILIGQPKNFSLVVPHMSIIAFLLIHNARADSKTKIVYKQTAKIFSLKALLFF